VRQDANLATSHVKQAPHGLEYCLSATRPLPTPNSSTEPQESKRQQELEAYALEEEIRLGTALGVELEQIITSGQLLRADHKERALDAYNDRHPRLAESLRSKMGKAFQGVLAVQKKGKGHAEGDGNITTASMGQGSTLQG